ncbi:hypothetical protein BDZ91DRAFT_713888 [Kalaharituber pfeilii]|nr:hypothetical protein BDZ91DRAFT_713888 [Kalaharituber pfeilii]
MYHISIQLLSVFISPSTPLFPDFLQISISFHLYSFFLFAIVIFFYFICLFLFVFPQI